jgi:(4-(4-[2-(gamma-L-glutamylamino)ethyl]phenoxymethyl)furan-2-yl)methanamine synthase
MAHAVAKAQLDEIVAAVHRVLARLPGPPQGVLLSGSGEFLARRAIQSMGPPPRVVSLTEELGETLSAVAPAHAVAALASETMTP